jgi:hypothetical protein
LIEGNATFAAKDVVDVSFAAQAVKDLGPYVARKH